MCAVSFIFSVSGAKQQQLQVKEGVVYFGSKCTEVSVHSQLVPDKPHRGETVHGRAQEAVSQIKDEGKEMDSSRPHHGYPSPPNRFHLPTSHLAVNSSVDSSTGEYQPSCPVTPQLHLWVHGALVAPVDINYNMCCVRGWHSASLWPRHRDAVFQNQDLWWNSWLRTGSEEHTRKLGLSKCLSPCVTAELHVEALRQLQICYCLASECELEATVHD